MVSIYYPESQAQVDILINKINRTEKRGFLFGDAWSVCRSGQLVRSHCMFSTARVTRSLNISHFDRFATFLKSTFLKDISCFLDAYCKSRYVNVNLSLQK